MAICAGIVSIPSLNFNKMITPVAIEDLDIKLPKGLKYNLALDQSSSCTGIAIQSVDERVTLILDCVNNCAYKATYYKELHHFLRKITQGYELNFVSHERPVPKAGTRYSSATLLTLMGHVESWFSEIPEFENARYVKILPQTWRKHVVIKDGEKAKSKKASKQKIARDICSLFPGLGDYFTACFSSDYDSFEALGILIGFKREAYTEQGNPRICGMEEKRHKALVCYDYKLKSNIRSIQDTVKVFGETLSIYKPKFLSWNESKTAYQNIRIASSEDPFIVTFPPEKVLKELQWKFNFEPDEEHVLIAYIVNVGKYSTGEISALKGVFTWNEIYS